MKRDEPVEKFRQIMDLIKAKAEADDYCVTQPIILEVIGKDGDIFARVYVETEYIRFENIPKDVTSLGDIPWVADLIKLGFRSNIMIIEENPESFRTADDVVNSVIMYVVRKYTRDDGLTEAEITELTMRYIRKVILVDIKLNNIYMVGDIPTNTRWLMTTEEWELLQAHGLEKNQRKVTHVRSLMVIEKNPGKPKVEMKLTEFIQTLPEKPIPRQFTRDEILNSQTKQNEHYAQIGIRIDNKIALESIRLDMQNEMSLKADDIRKLSRDYIEGIRANGDYYLRNLVRQYERELYNGNEMER